ncbi:MULTISPECIES: hypothetical protein [Hydrocarboniphaga]|uniref:Uncharacterized protein n=1 Tax=Hydrocarboniphaga effusa AP103 TaxID=1172194 RepID=I8T365_9GAMM|nr:MULTISPECIES: hypothetical protein [Hydrocarboniphaga]EIT68375.1 hypothetical protein WQQ_35700 [Hydrocarboniphaga effusa AP103]MDZ4078634.1 hypothetical protein [Hydrocarboniphaga sp.]
MNEIKAEFGLPKTAEFRGFIVHLPDSDEFVVSIEVEPSATRRVFAATPEAAKIYDSESAAADDAARCKQDTQVAMLFGEDGQLFVVYPE